MLCEKKTTFFRKRTFLKKKKYTVSMFSEYNSTVKHLWGNFNGKYVMVCYGKQAANK